MKSNVQRLPTARRRPPRTLEGWALGLLAEHHAITECEFRGHRKDRGDPDALIRARDFPLPASDENQIIGRGASVHRAAVCPLRKQLSNVWDATWHTKLGGRSPPS
jgi:hypothetical protein